MFWNQDNKNDKFFSSAQFQINIEFGIEIKHNLLTNVEFQNKYHID
jgi:hypothetical protein